MKLQRETILILIYIAIAIALAFVPTGFQRAIYTNATGAKARVLEVDNSTIYQQGLFKMGDQRCTVEILSGVHKGLVMESINMLSGSLANDKLFAKNDIAWVLIERDSNNEPIAINAIDYYRLSKEVLLIIVFSLALILFSGKRGARTILSFVLAFLLIWKVLIPLTLKGHNPIAVSLLVLIVQMSFTIFLVGGIGKRSIASLSGSILSAIITSIISLLLTKTFQIDGSVLASSESLLYAGFQDLNLTAIYSGAILLSAGGAIMDLSIDVASSIQEVSIHSPNLSMKEYFKSGMEVGRAGVGTQITTLLLAYMGSYLTILMVYMAQATPPLNILTGKQTAAEIVQTITGAFSLLLVSPLTAFFASKLFSKKNRA